MTDELSKPQDDPELDSAEEQRSNPLSDAARGVAQGAADLTRVVVDGVLLQSSIDGARDIGDGVVSAASDVVDGALDAAAIAGEVAGDIAGGVADVAGEAGGIAGDVAGEILSQS